MDSEVFLPFLLAFVSLGAFELGSFVRRKVHVIMPYKDPATLLLLILCLSPGIYGYCTGFFDPCNVWYLAFLVTFILCYSVSYIRDKPDIVYVNVHTIISERFPNGAQEVKPVVYYWDRNGNQCVQEQGIGSILKTVILGIHSPLRLDIGIIRRTRPIYVQKILYPNIFVDPIDVVEEVITESVVMRWIFSFRVRSYAYTPAPSCIDTTQQWLVSAYNQENLTRELTRKEAQLLETKLTSQSQFYARSADLLVEMINDRTPGAEVYQDVINRLAPDDGTPAPQPQRTERPPERKRLFRRRRE